MGYYTTYELIVRGDDGHEDAHKAAIVLKSGYPHLFHDGLKWYRHEKELLDYSKEYPEVLFELSGEGEESGDIWVKYFKNGKMQTSKAVFHLDPFDESKLK